MAMSIKVMAAKIKEQKGVIQGLRKLNRELNFECEKLLVKAYPLRTLVQPNVDFKGPEPKKLKYFYYIVFKTPESTGGTQVKLSYRITDISHIKEIESIIRMARKIKSVVVVDYELLRTEEVE